MSNLEDPTPNLVDSSLPSPNTTYSDLLSSDLSDTQSTEILGSQENPEISAASDSEATSEISINTQNETSVVSTNFPIMVLTTETSVQGITAEINRLARLINSNANLTPMKPLPTVLHNPDACFTGIPLEIRCEIYGHLLYNPLLAQSQSVSKFDDYGASAKYGLSPRLLEVSRGIHREASSSLYGQKFYMACLPSRGQSPFFAKTHLSPIIRYIHTSSGYHSIRNVSAITKVQKWNVIVSARDTEEDIAQSPPWSFLDFCHAIWRSQRKSVEIAIIRKRVENGLTDEDYQPMDVVLQPARFLRNLEHFQLRDATPFEVPDDVDQNEDAPEYLSQLEDEAALEVAITLLATGDNPLECAFEMYPCLLKYAQAFESNIYFKKEMSLREGEELSEECLGDHYDFYISNPLQNPFRARYTHPVEAALMSAKVASDLEDLVGFKNERAIILNYLENQYQRISEAASRVVEFVKEEKYADGLLDANIMDDPARYRYDRERNMAKVDLAMVLVEEYAETFKRDVPLAIKREIRLNQRLFDSFYSGSCIDSLMRRLREAFEIGNLTSFVDFFRSTVSELDERYLQILRLRKNIFKWDELSLNQIGCNIDPELSRSDEHINWSLNGPDIIIPEGSSDYFASTNDNSSDGSQWWG